MSDDVPPIESYPLSYKLHAREQDGLPSDITLPDTLYDASDAFRVAQLYANKLGKCVEVWSLPRESNGLKMEYVGRRNPAA